MNSSQKKPKFLSKPIILALVSLVIAGLAYSLWAIHIDHPKQSTSKADTCTINDKLVNSCRPWLAASVSKYPNLGTGMMDQVTAFETRIYGNSSKKLDAVKTYHVAGQTLSADDKYYAKRANTFLMLNWKPVSGSWANGNSNNTASNKSVDDMATSIESVGNHTIFLTMWHEPENDVGPGAGCTTYKGGMGTPDQFISMYRYAHDRLNAKLLADHSTTKIVYAIDYMNYAPWNCVWPQLYPGDAYVDWIVFNAYGGVDGKSFASNVNDFYSQLMNPKNNAPGHMYSSKYFGIAEFSARNTTEAQGISYFNQAKAVVESNQYPKLKLYMIFDNMGPDGNENRVYYTKGSVYDQAKGDAFKAFANSPAFSDSTPSDTTPPVVSVNPPANGTTVTGTVTVTANATDNVGVDSVKFYIDGTLLSTDTDGSDGWSATWTTTSVGNGSHTIKATGFDAAGNAGSGTSAVVVNNAAVPNITSFIATPTTVSQGGVSKLSWVVTGADNCSVAPGGPSGTQDSSWMTGALSATTTYTLTCTNAGGSKTATVTVTVVGAPQIVSLAASPKIITVGQDSILSWTTRNAVSCTVTPDGSVDTTATSWQTPQLTAVGTATYVLTCKNAAGATNSSTTSITVQPASNPPSSVVLTSDKKNVSSGGTVTLSWASVDSVSCTLNPGAFTASGTSSARTITNLKKTTTYSVVCRNAAGSATSNSLTVTVGSAGPAAPVITSLTAVPATVAPNAKSKLHWTTDNVAWGDCGITPSPISSTSANGAWTTPHLPTTTSFTLTCQNSAGTKVHKSVKITISNNVALGSSFLARLRPLTDIQLTRAHLPTTIASTTSSTTAAAGTIKATTGQEVVNARLVDSVSPNSLVAIDPATVTDSTEIAQITSVEYYSSAKLIETIKQPPFALDARKLSLGDNSITERVYFKDGSMSEASQLITVGSKKSTSTTMSKWLAIGGGVVVLLALIGAACMAPHFLRRRAQAQTSAPQDPMTSPVATHPPVVTPSNDQPHDDVHLPPSA